MGYNPRNANRHWIKFSATSILDIGRESFSDKPKMYAFLGLSNEKERKIVRGFNRLVKDANESPIDFIIRLWGEVYAQKDDGDLKYSNMMSQKITRDQAAEILEKLRFIALCLNGQEEPENFGWDGKSLRTNIDFNRRVIDRLTLSQLRSRIEGIMKIVCPGLTIKGDE